MFIERLIYSRLDDRFQAITEDPTIYERFLIKHGGLSEAEARIARLAWTERPASVVHGYARTGASFPVVSVVLGGENTAQDYIGEDGEPLDEEGLEYFDEDGDPVDVHVRRWENRFDLYIYAENPDECLFIYQLAKQIMVSGRSEMQAADLDEITFAGAELAPDPRYMPENMFTRRLSITLRSDQQYDDPVPARSHTIAGASIDDGERQDLPTLTDEQLEAMSAHHRGITTYTEDE